MKQWNGQKVCLQRGGGSRIHFHKGADFQKYFENFVDVDPFFKVDLIDFLRSPKALKDRFGQIFRTAANILKKKTGLKRRS